MSTLRTQVKEQQTEAAADRWAHRTIRENLTVSRIKVSVQSLVVEMLDFAPLKMLFLRDGGSASGRSITT